MRPELMWLGWTALLTALMWLPYVMNRAVVWGLVEAMGYPPNPKPLAPWAERAKKAHYNAVENLVVFGALVLTASASNKLNDATALSAMVYFWARLAHFLIYAAGIAWLRTISWTVGWVACLCIAWQLLH